MSPPRPGAAPLTTALSASAVRLDGDVDLVGLGGGPEGVVWLRHGVGFAGAGVAALVDVPAGARAEAGGRTAAVLGAITPHGDPDAPLPVAFGALAFDREAPARLVVPRLQAWRRPDGARWAVVVHPAGSAPPAMEDLLRPGPESEPPTALSISASQEPAWWADLVARTAARIRTGELRKVVLARELVLTANRPIDPRPVLRRLAGAYPACFVAHVEGFVAASPELLVSRRGDVVRAQPMAGTAPRSGDPATDARLAAGLLANPNYRNEHQVTIDMVHDTLLGWCSYLDAEPEPSVVAVANVQHLATLVEGRLSRPEPSVLDLVAALHPTPAVGGDPREVALAVRAEVERLDRRRYAGPVGWVDTAGNGEWAVGVRSAELEGSTARIYAGNGIVADSDPATELAETQAKFQALLGALVRL